MTQPHPRPPAAAPLARLSAVVVAVFVVVGIGGCADACAPPPHGALTDGVGPDTHPYFPIDDGAVHAFGRATDDVEAITCTTCHTNRGTFVEFNCVRCHEHEPVAIDLLHSATTGYAYASKDCFACHASGVQDPPFSHAVGQNQCATCHDEGAAFHALPVEGFTHPPRGTADCSSCHLSTTDWKDVSGAPASASDPLKNIEVSALLPVYAGTSVASVTPSTQTLSMPMNHGSADVDPSLLTTCTACHADTTSYYPGRLHGSLEALLAGEPTGCVSCHASSVPVGFVGALATSPPRDPATGEMKHDAVIWTADAPTTTALVTQDCVLCHQPPTTARPSTWATPASFHTALDQGGVAQPDSCLDCHANSRPQAVLTSSTAALASGIAFDHRDGSAQGECTACHAASFASPLPATLSWGGGRFHLADNAAPTSCNACHEGQRPTTTTDWQDPDFERAPFDFVTNAAGLTHGAGQDCVTCHASTQTWQGGNFEHGEGTPSATTCIACHSTQRPDLVVANAATLLGFDHASNGSGDCIGCHQASVVAGRYASFFNPTTSTLPGGDWQGGVAYPGAFPIAGADDIVNVAELALVTDARAFVTGTTPVSEALPQAMVHTATALPPPLQAGAGPDNTVCWHCHENNNGVVTQTVGGVFHDAFATFRATPGGAVSPLAQPQTGCNQCHVAPSDARITLGRVAGSSSSLVPMDHGVTFTAAVTIDGASVTGVRAMDCATCHKDPGGSWVGGTFHDKVASASLPDCVRCHFPTMADGALADVVNNPDYVMKHRSTQVGSQRCDTCHTGALAVATTRPAATSPAATMWAGATLHEHVPAQPTVCIECHAATSPATLTQSTERYVLAAGASTSNEAQWMSHRSTTVAQQDCERCHAADAVSGAWDKATTFHARVSTPTTCRECHGTGAPGAPQNNLPVGLTSSDTVTSAASSPSTGVAAGTRDQLTHADANVTRHDCNFCHTQAGPSTATGVAGKEWAQATFHARFSAGDPLLSNGTTARCSSCHLNVKPGAAYVVDHAAFTDAPGSVDCAACHAWPGTGSASSPNWQGATGGAPSTMAVGGFSVPQPPATNATTFAPSIPNLPHPTVPSGTSCATCHDGGTAGRNAFAYDHAPAQIAGKCSACHEAGTDLARPAWNGATTLDAGAGDSRPFTVASFVATTPAYPGRSLTVDGTNHFFPTDCNECHAATPGVLVTTTTGAAYTAAWGFPHDQTKMNSPSTCVQCHGNNLAPLDLVDDPLAARDVTALVPTFASTTIASVSPSVQTLPMPMDHTANSIPVAATTSCGSCHSDAVNFYPGAFHSSLANLGLQNPDRCVECHVPSTPSGFVGPLATAPVRSPSSGEMRHDAVAWLVDRPTASGLVPQECALCHVAPSATLAATWATPSAAAATPVFHDSLDAAALPQPDSCLDCHANSRATTTYTTANAPTLPAGVSFDHAQPAALVDCVSCHANTQTTTWGGGRFHRPGDANPTSCLPCHDGERPTSTSTWTSATFRAAPFDFVTNASGIGHGADRDCVECHAGPGTRGATAAAWGVNQTWEGGVFDHAGSALTDTTCILCHTTQRADRVLANSTTLLGGFNHATDGTGDCIGCHQATVVANHYARLFNAQGTFPGGDWQGGVDYPGSTLITTTSAFVRLTETTLLKTGNRVTGTTSTTATLPNAMLHTSATITNPALQAGPTGSPDSTTCWHCHTSTGTTVTSFANGQFHDALTNFRATPGGAVTPQAQPTLCLDCHAQMRPDNIVSTPSLTLQPMDHAALFTAPTTIGGRSVTGVAQMECAQCHVDAGGVWSDGRFHSKIGTATPADCVQCHYPLMATTALADKASGTTYAMKHGSTQLTTQACNTCHTTALSRSTQTPAATLWNDGTLHPHTSPQPTSCNECHVGSRPAISTQGTVNWAFTSTSASSGTNAGQWMSHTLASVTSRDCVACHAADARTSGSAWSKTAPFHAVVTNATTCRECHGLTNGNGSVVGTKNNMPVGLTNSQTTSSVAGVANTGVAAGTKDQIAHTDVNVTGRDCNFCHTQAGTSSTAGIAGKEWSQADFHARFNAANPLLMNGTTGRCSNCHLNVKPGTAYPVSHASFTAASGTTDCASCHSWPGTGTASAPNWQGAVGGAPVTLTVGGFAIAQPPAAGPTTQAGVTGLPHPSGTTCVSCHANGAGGKNAIGYDHASTVANNHCNACHEAGSNLLSPVWNGATTLAAGLGDTRPFTITTMNVTFSGNTCRNVNTAKHFYPVDCYQCHNAPTGTVVGATTNATLQTRWAFPHRESRMTNPTTCNLCHGAPNNCPK